VALDIASTPVIIYNIHPLHPGMVMLDVSERTADLNTVLTRVENDPADVPIIIGGDMNMTDLTADYRRIRQLGFSDAHKEAGRGFGFTFPAVGAPPLIRLDQIFYNSYWTAIEAEVIPQGNGSDHFPVRVVLDLNTQ
jgi:endonuclease/exonuclease/phosphatase (EEP) superfamily protein YafD